jgi:hypothetical protein
VLSPFLKIEVMKARRQTVGTHPSLNKIWNKNANGWHKNEQVFLIKIGGMPSGPPADLPFNFFTTRETKTGLKTIDDKLLSTGQDLEPGKTPLSVVNCV